MERLTHDADFGFEDWEETLFFVKSDPNGAYNILDIARFQGEAEFDEILKNIALRLAAYEDTGFTPEEIQQMRWIPVEERLPKPEFKDQQRGFYLVTLSNGVVKELIYEFRHYDNMMFDVGWHDTAFPVTHWMPLPKLPKEGTNGKH